MISVLKEEFEVVQDPRVSGRTRHLLIDILVIGVLAVICGVDTWEEMHEFGQSRRKWLKRFLELPNGIPSHDTFLRIFSIINPKDFELAFMNWVKRIKKFKKRETDTICVDRKSIRGTSIAKMGAGCKGLHLVSAWSTRHGLVGQAKAKGRGYGELAAAIEILSALEI